MFRHLGVGSSMWLLHILQALHAQLLINENASTSQIPPMSSEQDSCVCISWTFTIDHAVGFTLLSQSDALNQKHWFSFVLANSGRIKTCHQLLISLYLVRCVDQFRAKMLMPHISGNGAFEQICQDVCTLMAQMKINNFVLDEISPL